MFKIIFFATVVLTTYQKALSQADPWPPIITSCDVMSLIVKDLNTRPDLVSCVSSSCDTIKCRVTSNNDQLELELLPCWHQPAMSIKNRDTKGNMLYLNTFASSAVALANIGGKTVLLNVTVVQRSLTLGFGVDIAVPGVINQTTTVIPYRDIPLHLTECPGGIQPDYPLMCKMILYMEQYIMTAYSANTHDPALIPNCESPDTSACDTMSCSWKDAWDTPITHTYQFYRCAKPQYFDLTLIAGLHHYGYSFDKSSFFRLNSTKQLNITVQNQPGQTFGFEVDLIETFSNITEIPFTKLPLSTDGCPNKTLKSHSPSQERTESTSRLVTAISNSAAPGGRADPILSNILSIKKRSRP